MFSELRGDPGGVSTACQVAMGSLSSYTGTFVWQGGQRAIGNLRRAHPCCNPPQSAISTATYSLPCPT
eukprot:11660109-Alexandrium_andersonii.AAC.1